MNTTEILEVCSKIKGDKALATNEGSKELLEKSYQTVCDQGSCNHEDGHDMILSCCGERVVDGYLDCETIVLEGASSGANVVQMPNLKSRGWSLVKLGKTLVYTKNPEIANALKNPKKVEIQVEKPSEDAIIDMEKDPIAAPVGTTPDPTVLFPEEEKQEEEEKLSSWNPMKTEW